MRRFRFRLWMLLLLVALVAVGLYAEQTRRRWQEWSVVNQRERAERGFAAQKEAEAREYDDAGNPGRAAELRTLARQAIEMADRHAAKKRQLEGW
jgi:hypothetical protein